MADGILSMCWESCYMFFLSFSGIYSVLVLVPAKRFYTDVISLAPVHEEQPVKVTVR